jgi:AraC-like DNA-binding protein
MADDPDLDDIAVQAGFCDRFFLARQFKAVVGMPPGRWRDETLGRPPR